MVFEIVLQSVYTITGFFGQSNLLHVEFILLRNSLLLQYLLIHLIGLIHHIIDKHIYKT